MPLAPYQLGFSTVHQEGEFAALPLQGQIPDWLNGNLIRTGPGTLKVGQQAYHHWFDGLAMLRKFSFADGQVAFANRFLESQAYREAKAKGKISRGEFGTTARHSLWERMIDPLPRLTDNATVNITMQGDRFISVTESPFPIIFDPTTLKTIDQFHYQDHVPGQITTAHPHFDFDENASYSYLVNLIPQCQYSIYRMDAHSHHRQLISTIPVKQPAYMHTFGMTQHYLILVEFPLRLNRLSLALSGKPYIENYEWRPEQGTRFLIIRKSDGRVVHVAQSDAFFAFHHVNAFEQEDEIVVDLIAYADAAVIQSLYLNSLLHHPEQVIAAGELRRYQVPLNTAMAHYQVLTTDSIELPRINYPRCNARNYRFAYGVSNSRPGNFTDQLVKVDVTSGATQIWHTPDCYPGEPVFVAAPQAITEDDGVILSVVLNVQSENSFLLVLDAQSWQELARVQVPYALPFDFHGQYFDETVPTAQAHLHR